MSRSSASMASGCMFRPASVHCKQFGAAWPGCAACHPSIHPSSQPVSQLSRVRRWARGSQVPRRVVTAHRRVGQVPEFGHEEGAGISGDGEAEAAQAAGQESAAAGDEPRPRSRLGLVPRAGAGLLLLLEELLVALLRHLLEPAVRDLAQRLAVRGLELVQGMRLEVGLGRLRLETSFAWDKKKKG